MTHLDPSLAIVEEWRRKSFELYNQSQDGLLSLMTKGLDSMVLLLSQSTDRNHIERALLTLESERNIAMKFEEKKNDAVRLVAYGILESLHVILRRFTEKIEALECTIAKKVQFLAVVEQCTQTDDILAPNIWEDEFAFKEEYMPDNIMNPLMEEATLAMENSFYVSLMKKEMVDAPAHEIVSSELFSGNASLGEISDECDQILSTPLNQSSLDMEESAQFENIDNCVRHSMADDLVEEQESIDDSVDTPQAVTVNDRERLPRSFSRLQKRAEFSKDSDENPDSLVKRRKSQLISTTEMKCPMCEFRTRSAGSWVSHLHHKHSTNAAQSGFALLCECGTECFSRSHALTCEIANFTVIRKNNAVKLNAKDARSSMPDDNEASFTDHSMDSSQESSSGTPTVTRTRPQRSASRPQKRATSQDSDEDYADQSVKRNTPKESESIMECTKCEYIARTATSWYAHLMRIHETNLTNERIALLCECGHESRSNMHASTAGHANVIIVRMNEGVETTPKCIMCDKYPATPYAYAQHLYLHHGSTLEENGIYLVCSCGDEKRSNSHDPSHNKKCRGLQFTLHKLDKN